MARPRGLIEVVCQNPDCDYFQKEDGKDIIKRGPDAKTGHQRYYCYHCRKFFMETKGTPLFNKKLSESEIINICKHFVEKNGIRSIERITGHHRVIGGIKFPTSVGTFSPVIINLSIKYLNPLSAVRFVECSTYRASFDLSSDNFHPVYSS
jgi:hypothetical protein